jgi:O-antigen ligase
MEASHLSLYLAVFSMAAFGTRDEEESYRIIRTLVIFAFVLGVFGIVQHATWNGKIYWFKSPLHSIFSPFGPFVNRNHFAGFVGMIIPFSLAVALMSTRTEKKVMYGFFGVVTTIALFYSLSRGGILSFVAGMLVFSFVIFTKGRSKRMLMPVLLFVLVAGTYLIFFGISPIIDRFAQGEVSIDQRLSVWKGTLTAFRDFPVFGSGFGTFEYIYKIYQPEGPPLYWTHAHNDYVEFLLEFGIAGTLIAGLFFFLAFTTLMKPDWTNKELYLHAAFLSSMTTITVHSMFDFNLRIPSNAILFFLVLGLAVSASRGKLMKNKKERLWRHGQLSKTRESQP